MTSDIVSEAAQQAARAADYALYGLLTTIAGLAILAIYTAFTGWQAFLTKDALKEASKSSALALAQTQASNAATEKTMR